MYSNKLMLRNYMYAIYIMLRISLWTNVFQEVLTALDTFSCYHHIWQRDKEENVNKLMMRKPLLSEFESEILHFQGLELKISSEPEYICVGAIALYTGRVRFSTSLLRHVLSDSCRKQRCCLVLEGWPELESQRMAVCWFGCKCMQTKH